VANNNKKIHYIFGNKSNNISQLRIMLNNEASVFQNFLQIFSVTSNFFQNFGQFQKNKLVPNQPRYYGTWQLTLSRKISNILELSLKSGDQGARTASFGIIGHQTPNWDPNWFFHQFWW
jgi:hypothetical protein